MYEWQVRFARVTVKVQFHNWSKPEIAPPASDEAEISLRELGLALCGPNPCCVPRSAAQVGVQRRSGRDILFAAEFKSTQNKHTASASPIQWLGVEGKA